MNFMRHLLSRLHAVSVCLKSDQVTPRLTRNIPPFPSAVKVYKPAQDGNPWKGGYTDE